jgi:hypothetical protein
LAVWTFDLSGLPAVLELRAIVVGYLTYVT